MSRYKIQTNTTPWSRFSERTAPRHSVRRDPKLHLLAYHESAHGIATLAFGGNLRKITTVSEETRRGFLSGHTHWDSIRSPFERLVMMLVGEKSDEVFFSKDHDEESHDRLDARQLATAIEADTGEVWSDVMARAEIAAGMFVRKHQNEIRLVGERLYDAQTLTGDEVLDCLNRAYGEDVPAKGDDPDEEFNRPPRPKRKVKRVYAEDAEEVEEPNVGEIEDIEDDTYTDEDKETQIHKKKKIARAGRFGDSNAYWRTDGMLGGFVAAGGASVRSSNYEPNERALYERAVRFWSTGE
jgi:hypothetical protein